MGFQRLLLLCFMLSCFHASTSAAQPTAAEGVPVISDGEALEEVQQIPVEQEVELQEEQLRQARGVRPFQLERVDIECDLPQCEDEAFHDAVLDMIAMEEGETIDGEIVERAVRRLARSLLFAQIQFEVDGGAIRWTLNGATVIRRVKVRAGLALSSKIERRISFRSGGIWSGDPEIVELQRRSIREYFQRDGFYGTTVEIEVTEVSEFVVDVEIKIDRGGRLSIRRVFVRGNEAFTYDEIFEVLLSEFNFLRGYTSNAFADAADSVIDMYRKAGYIEARILDTEEDILASDGVVDLYLELDEGPRWELLVNGNRRFTQDRIIAASGVLQAGFVDRTELDAAEKRIEELYETRGYFFANVTVEQRDVGDSRALSIVINEGNVAEIRRIQFVGNEALSNTDLRSLLTTSEYDLVTRGGYLQRARLDSEIELITDMYRKAGYPWARVERAVFLAENDGRELYVSLFIYEGPQVLVSDASVAEPTRDDDEQDDGGESMDPAEATAIDERLELHPGAVFQREKLSADRETISEFWRRRGFGAVDVRTRCHAGSTELEECRFESVTRECTLSLVKDREASCSRTNFGDRTVEECLLAVNVAECQPPTEMPTVSLSHEVEAGQRTRIGHILVRGAFRSRDWVIVSEIPLLGECQPARRRIDLRTSGFEPPPTCTFNRDLLLQGQSNIRALGLYDSVRMEVIGPDEDTDAATIVISVEETTTRFVEYRIGLNSRPTGQDNNQFRSTNALSYRDINFLGRGEELRFVSGFDYAIGEGRVIRDGEFDAELRAIYFDPRFYLFGALKKPWEARLELAYEHELLPIAPAPQTKTISLEGVLRDSIRKFRGVFFEVGLSVRRTLTLDQSEIATSDEFEPSFILSVRPRVTIERRDNPLNPTRGYFGEFTLEIADDFLGFLNSERFTSFTTGHSVYLPLGPFVVALNGRVGFGFGGILSGFRREGDLSLPLSERFFLGGVNSVRGLPQNGLDSIGTDEPGGDVFFNANAELRYPLIPSASIYGAVFFDVGQLAADVGDLDISETVLTGGLGIRWLIADIVPLVLDYGVILNRRTGDEFGRLHFNIGYTF